MRRLRRGGEAASSQPDSLGSQLQHELEGVLKEEEERGEEEKEQEEERKEEEEELDGEDRYPVS